MKQSIFNKLFHHGFFLLAYIASCSLAQAQTATLPASMSSTTGLDTFTPVGGNITITASSEFSSAYAGYKAIGTAGSDEWACVGSTGYLSVFYDVAINITKAVLRARSNNVEYPTNWKIQASSNGIT